MSSTARLMEIFRGRVVLLVDSEYLIGGVLQVGHDTRRIVLLVNMESLLMSSATRPLRIAEREGSAISLRHPTSGAARQE